MHMAKSLQIIILSALLLAIPLGVAAQEVTVKGNVVRINDAEGQVLKIYNLTGTEVSHHRIDSNDVQLNLSKLPKGYYIIKVGKVVRKISIR